MWSITGKIPASKNSTKKNIDSFVWRVRDNDQEKNNFVFLIIKHNHGVIVQVEVKALSISAMGEASDLCGNLTQNEQSEVSRIMSVCVDS